MTDREALLTLKNALTFEYQHAPEGMPGHRKSRMEALSEQVADAWQFVENHLEGRPSVTAGMLRPEEFDERMNRNP